MVWTDVKYVANVRICKWKCSLTLDKHWDQLGWHLDLWVCLKDQLDTISTGCAESTGTILGAYSCFLDDFWKNLLYDKK